MAVQHSANMDMISDTQTTDQPTAEHLMESEQSTASSEYSSTSDMETVSSGENSSESQEEFTPVKGRKRGNSGGVSPSATGSKVPYSGAQSLDLNSGLTVPPKTGLNVYRIITREFTSELEVLALLHCKYPKLDCGRKQTSNRSVLLIPKTQKVCDLLESLTKLNGKNVSFEAMKNKSNVQTGILSYVPPYLTEEAIMNTEKVLSAARIFRWDPVLQQKVETEMVKFTYEGPLPAKIRLGICGNFRVRPFVPNPTRCYKCQKFGHVATTCRSRAPRCRLCAGAHMTEQCQALRNNGRQVEVKCANCGQAHPASSGLCTKLRDITATKRTQAAQKFKPAPLPSTNAWGQTGGGKVNANKNVEVNRPPIGLTEPKNVSSGKVSTPPSRPQQAPQNPAKRTFADFFKNPASYAPAAFRGMTQLTAKTPGGSLPPGGAQPPGGAKPSGGAQPPPKAVLKSVKTVVHQETPAKTNEKATEPQSGQNIEQVEASTAEEEQFIELITNAVDMAKRDLDLIQKMMIRNMKHKNTQVKEYLIKQSEKVTQNLTDLRNLM